MNTSLTPADAALVVLRNPTLPVGDDERFVGFGVLSLPFASGHYLALRCISGAAFAPGYRSVWHRDAAGGVDVLCDQLRGAQLRPLFQ